MHPTQRMSHNHIFLVSSSPNHLQRIIRQRSLKGLRLVGAHHTSRSSSVVRITGIAFGWNGSTTAFGGVVAKPLPTQNVCANVKAVAAL